MSNLQSLLTFLTLQFLFILLHSPIGSEEHRSDENLKKPQVTAENASFSFVTHQNCFSFFYCFKIKILTLSHVQLFTNLCSSPLLSAPGMVKLSSCPWQRRITCPPIKYPDRTKTVTRHFPFKPHHTVNVEEQMYYLH